MYLYGVILRDSIEAEKNGKDFVCSEKDRATLRQMLTEINALHHSNYKYLAEVAFLDMSHSSDIILNYIEKFDSETIRAYLLPHITSKKVQNCDKLVLDLYFHFKNSDFYIPHIEKFSSAHIFARYDNAFVKLKSKKIEKELLGLVSNPIDAFYLPLTTRMLSKRKFTELETLFTKYLNNPDSILECSDVQLYIKSGKTSSAEYLQRQLLFTAINGLKNFPSTENVELLKVYSNSSNMDIRKATEKSIKAILKKLTECTGDGSLCSTI